jgi:two-component system KDP operon response regulator KdpE
VTDGSAPLILVVEDDAPVRRFLRTALTAHGYRVAEAASAAEALATITTAHPDVLLLDLGLPDRDGIDVTREIREWGCLPIIVISARGREEDKVRALDAGADDYLTKPFGTKELLARIGVALRHAAQVGAAPTAETIDVGTLHVDQVRREVSVGGVPVHLTPIEYKLIVLLARNAGRVLTHHQILKEVWGSAYAAERHTLRVFMMQLRRKLEPNSVRPQILITEPGVGYRLREP